MVGGEGVIEQALQISDTQPYLWILAALWLSTVLVAAIVGINFPSFLGAFIGLFIVWGIGGLTWFYLLDTIGLMDQLGLPLLFLASLLDVRLLFYLVIVALLVALRRKKKVKAPDFARKEPTLGNQNIQ